MNGSFGPTGGEILLSHAPGRHGLERPELHRRPLGIPTGQLEKRAVHGCCFRARPFSPCVEVGGVGPANHGEWEPVLDPKE